MLLSSRLQIRTDSTEISHRCWRTTQQTSSYSLVIWWQTATMLARFKTSCAGSGRWISSLTRCWSQATTTATSKAASWKCRSCSRLTKTSATCMIRNRHSQWTISLSACTGVRGLRIAELGLSWSSQRTLLCGTRSPARLTFWSLTDQHTARWTLRGTSSIGVVQRCRKW